VREAGSRWGMVAAGAALIGCCYGFARFAYGLFAPQIQDEFAMTSTLSGVVSAGSYVGYCAAIVVSMLLTERLGARIVAVMAGAVATVGTLAVAVAPSAVVLAVGVLVAGSSTGLASPPLAAAIARWVREEGRDRAQTVANAGTGLGVVVSGPIALVVTDEWRWAWATFAVVSAAVTLWVARVVPGWDGSGGGLGRRGRRWAAGANRLVAGALLMGASSMAVWTFGQDVVAAGDAGGPLLPGLTWMVLGAAGVAGAFSGDLVSQLGLAVSWTMSLLVMAGATLLLATLADQTAAVLLAATLFGAAYIALTGILLVWGTRLFPDNPSYGVMLAFLVIAVGQAAFAPALGVVADATTLTTAFVVCAFVGTSAAFVQPRPRATGDLCAGPDAR
jgi:predicted MFS family arabinose efflux permease